MNRGWLKHGTEIIIKQPNDRHHRMMREYLMEILNGPMSIFKHLSRVIKSIVILSMNLLFPPFPSYFDNPKQSRRENRLTGGIYAKVRIYFHGIIFNYLVYFNRETEHWQSILQIPRNETLQIGV